MMSSTNAPYNECLGYLRRGLNNPRATFRDGQWEAISAIVERHSKLLVVQRTGWGKSMVYFVATRYGRIRGAGPTVLISPLLALIRNQIAAAERLQLRATSINSSNTDDWAEIVERLREGSVDLLLVSPERLGNEQFRTQVLPEAVGRIGLLVVDEAHCISDWGHDFRPDYRRIVKVVKALPRGVPVLATTATANERVVNDVVHQLGEGLMVSHGPLTRESLQLQNIHLPGQAARMAWLADTLPTLPGSGIVYTLTVRDAQHVAEWLQSRGIDAAAYYGELDSFERERLEARLLNNDIKTLVATSALGMGYDKPDLHYVIHFQRPASVVHYYQQIGRAGRAVDSAPAVLLCGAEDDDIAEYFMRTSLPPREHVEQIIAALSAHDRKATMHVLERSVNLSFSQIQKVLTLLAVEDPPVVERQDREWRLLASNYAADSGPWDRLLATRRREQERMRQYASSSECLMVFLRRELDDHSAVPCGKCANCLGYPVVPIGYALETANAAVRFLRRCEEPIVPRKRWPPEALAEHGWTGNIRPELQAQTGRVLCRWGDAGWGDLVAEGKLRTHHFDDQLVEAAADLIRERWIPDPLPAWLTCVPSLRHPTLVPDFARRLGERLHLPFVPCIIKMRGNPAQKTMQNSFQQSRNLAGVFTVKTAMVPPAPVLLVDDLVDSGWTFTVLAAQLQEAGSGPVYPFALARSTSK